MACSFLLALGAQKERQLKPLLKRSDAGFWQGASGGGEDDETPLAAARRETFEETGLPPTSAFLALDTVEPIPVITFGGSERWGEAVFIIKQYCFGVLAVQREIKLSQEHVEYQWLSYEDAYRRLKYDGNRTALWELNQRLKGRGPRG
jgi:dATP pyrophosphohydrolase